jgi:predicted DNA-binding ribbon-helix-helix protein
MSVISLRLPDSIHKALRDLAVQENVSINQLIATAATEKVSALMTEDYLKMRAAQGHLAKAKAVLKKVSSRAPEAQDRL